MDHLGWVFRTFPVVFIRFAIETTDEVVAFCKALAPSVGAT
jgi:hypothetical protein